MHRSHLIMHKIFLKYTIFSILFVYTQYYYQSKLDLDLPLGTDPSLFPRDRSIIIIIRLQVVVMATKLVNDAPLVEWRGGGRGWLKDGGGLGGSIVDSSTLYFQVCTWSECQVAQHSKWHGTRQIQYTSIVLYWVVVIIFYILLLLLSCQCFYRYHYHYDYYYCYFCCCYTYMFRAQNMIMIMINIIIIMIVDVIVTPTCSGLKILVI